MQKEDRTLTRLPKKLRRTVRVFGRPCVYDRLAEAQHEHLGLVCLDRDRLGSVTTYYVRLGVDERGTATRGGMPFKRAGLALAAWNRLWDA